MNTSSLEQLKQSSAVKMERAGVSALAIRSFLSALEKVHRGDRGLMSESSLQPLETLPREEALAPAGPGAAALLNQLAVVKLNGGLGTGMGLDRAKSLIRVKGDSTFLDFIARQILHFREAAHAPELSFLLMNSFSTRQDTLDYLARYPGLGGGRPIDFLQSKAPKLLADTLEPVTWPEDPELEWCPPGHGDIYPSLVDSGMLADLRRRGIRYLFVSNADNLGAAVDLPLLEYFANSSLAFLMEVAERTPLDRKGGHLAVRREDGRLVLRESAQCPDADMDRFQDIQTHRYFNTNNLWIQLDLLEEELARHSGILPLPLIRNAKTVDPRRADSPKVLQLETAMGAAIECFPRAGAIVVSRHRFAPVKTTADLLILQSDACHVTADHRIELLPARHGQPPEVELDPRHYKLIADFDRAFAGGIPSLAGCHRLKVTGPFLFQSGVVVEGEHEWSNPGSTPEVVPAGRYGR